MKNPDRVYVGYTVNLKERLKEHNSGDSFSTATLRPWELVMYSAFKDMTKAKEFEKYLKSHSGRIFAQKRFW